MPAVNHPSSSSNGLRLLTGCCTTRERDITKAAPNIAVGRIDLEDGAQILDGRGEGVLGAQDARNALHSGDRPLVVLQGLLVALHGAVKVLHLL